MHVHIYFSEEKKFAFQIRSKFQRLNIIFLKTKAKEKRKEKTYRFLRRVFLSEV